MRVRGRVRKYRLRGREGVVDTDRGAALVRGWDILEGGRECVEASLEVGEEVEVVLVESEGAGGWGEAGQGGHGHLHCGGEQEVGGAGHLGQEEGVGQEWGG